MLVELSIENLGVLPSATASWAPGLTVLTGETGAGKTFLLSGLKLIQGARADSSRVREGQSQAFVEGIFDFSEIDDADRAAITDEIENVGGDTENNEVVVSRSVSSKGRSRAHVGGRTVTAGRLAAVVDNLLVIHGQNDQLRLLSTDQQRDALDSFDPEIATVKSRYQVLRDQWRSVTRELTRRQQHRREMAQEEDRLRFALDEIEAVSPTPHEDELLVDKVKRLQEVDSLRDSAGRAFQALSSDDTEETSSAIDLLGEAQSALASSGDSQLVNLGTQIHNLLEQVGDISSDLSRYLGGLSSDPGELDAALQRQAQLNELTRKYAANIDAVLEWRDNAYKRLESLDTSTETIEKLAKEAEEAGIKTREIAEKLTAARRRAARKLEQAVTEEMRGLAMPTSSLDIAVTTNTVFRKNGTDEVEFRLRSYDGAEPRPLTQAASGGELSRIMLALEVVLSAERRGTTIVFDEVDAGVGGRAGVEIGRRLMRLSRQCQVIVVTHLPQVAAFADQHLVVTKSVDASVAATSGIKTLVESERVEELARMLAGLDHTDTGRAHAEELLATAARERSQA